jgi:hypothetical protein
MIDFDVLQFKEKMIPAFHLCNAIVQTTRGQPGAFPLRLPAPLR